MRQDEKAVDKKWQSRWMVDQKEQRLTDNDRGIYNVGFLWEQVTGVNPGPDHTGSE